MGSNWNDAPRRGGGGGGQAPARLQPARVRGDWRARWQSKLIDDESECCNQLRSCWQLTAKSSFVLLYVPTPSLGRSQAGRTERDGVGQDLPVEEWWVEDHAHQVLVSAGAGT